MCPVIENATSGRTGEASLESAVAQIFNQYRAGSAPEAAFWEAYAEFFKAVGDNEAAEEGLYKRV